MKGKKIDLKSIHKMMHENLLIRYLNIYSNVILNEVLGVKRIQDSQMIVRSQKISRNLNNYWVILKILIEKDLWR
jgi:hypothetical protein